VQEQRDFPRSCPRYVQRPAAAVPSTAHCRRPHRRLTLSRWGRGAGWAGYTRVCANAKRSLSDLHRKHGTRGGQAVKSKMPGGPYLIHPVVPASSDVAWSGSGAQSRHAPRARDDSGSRQRRRPRPRPPLLIHLISTKQIPRPANPGFALLVTA
jgi:hypothetical protein